MATEQKKSKYTDAEKKVLAEMRAKTNAIVNRGTFKGIYYKVRNATVEIMKSDKDNAGKKKALIPVLQEALKECSQ
jgi:hypothetical protein